MKFVFSLVSLLLISQTVFSAFPTNQCSATVDSAYVTGQWNSFRWDMTGYEDQLVNLYFKDNATWLNLDGFYASFKVAKKTSSGQVSYIVKTSDQCTVSKSNITFTISYTNIPPDGRYLAELWLWSGTTTNTARVMAQGIIDTHNSLYSVNDTSYPWPADQDNLANYVPLSDAVYLAAVTQLTATAGSAFNAAVASRIGTFTYPSTTVTSATQTAGASFGLAVAGSTATLTYPNTTLTNISASAPIEGSISGGTLTLAGATIISNLTGDTEIVVAGAGNTRTLSIGSAIARDTEVTAATGTLYITIGTLYVPLTRTLTAGDGLSGGGTLAADRAFAVDGSVVRTNTTEYSESVTNVSGAGICTASKSGRIVTVTGTEADTLATVTVRGATTSQNLLLLGNSLSLGPNDGTRNASAGQQGLVNGGYCGNSAVQDNEAAGSLNYGYLLGLMGFPPSYACQTNTGFGSGNFGYVSAGAIQGISGSGSMNIGYLGIGEAQTTTADGCLNVGTKNTASHNYAMVFGNGVTSVDTNAVHARKYYENGTALAGLYYGIANPSNYTTLAGASNVVLNYGGTLYDVTGAAAAASNYAASVYALLAQGPYRTNTFVTFASFDNTNAIPYYRIFSGRANRNWTLLSWTTWLSDGTGTFTIWQTAGTNYATLSVMGTQVCAAAGITSNSVAWLNATLSNGNAVCIEVNSGGPTSATHEVIGGAYLW